MIESVAGVEGNRIAISTTGKAVSIDDSALRTDIADAKKAGTDAATVASQAVQAAGENANKIQTNTGDITNLKTLTSEHTEKISAIESANSTHDAEFKALKSTVEGHTSAIAGKAEQSALDAVSSKASANEQAIKTLNETTIPAINEEVAKKANASALESYYTKTEADGKYVAKETGKSLISDAEIARLAEVDNYDDTAVRALITDITKEGGAIATAVAAEAEIARAAEKANADEIARVDAALKAAVENDGEGLDSIKELAIWIENHGEDATNMAKAIEANAEAIANIYTPAEGENAASGVLVDEVARVEKAIADGDAATLKSAKDYTDAEIAKVHTVDDDTIKLSENKAYVAKVSTDVLVQGSLELVLCGGNASGFATNA